MVIAKSHGTPLLHLWGVLDEDPNADIHGRQDCGGTKSRF